MIARQPTQADTHLIVTLPRQSFTQPGERRYVYFETSREGVTDRQGEDIAAKALWDSRDVFLESGDLDLGHLSKLANRSELIIGVPVDAKRSGKSIYVKGEIFSNLTAPPAGSNGEWADRFWHSNTGMQPGMRWFPSVFGKIKAGGIELQKRGDQMIRFINSVEWTSVGFWPTVQNPALGPISLTPVGTLAKAVTDFTDLSATALEAITRPDVLRLSWGTFAKSMADGAAFTATAGTGTDSALKTGVDALAPESLQGGGNRHKRMLRRVLAGEVQPRQAAIHKAFMGEGCDEASAAKHTMAFLSRMAKAGR